MSITAIDTTNDAAFPRTSEAHQKAVLDWCWAGEALYVGDDLSKADSVRLVSILDLGIQAAFPAISPEAASAAASEFLHMLTLTEQDLKRNERALLAASDKLAFIKSIL